MLRYEYRDFVARDAEDAISAGTIELERTRTPEADMEVCMQLQDLQACLMKIGRDIAPRRLAAFRAYVLEGVSASETAKRFGLSKGHVYVIRHTVLNLLREHMQRMEEKQS